MEKASFFMLVLITTNILFTSSCDEWSLNFGGDSDSDSGYSVVSNKIYIITQPKSSLRQDAIQAVDIYLDGYSAYHKIVESDYDEKSGLWMIKVVGEKAPCCGKPESCTFTFGVNKTKMVYLECIDGHREYYVNKTLN